MKQLNLKQKITTEVTSAFTADALDDENFQANSTLTNFKKSIVNASENAINS